MPYGRLRIDGWASSPLRELKAGYGEGGEALRPQRCALEPGRLLQTEHEVCVLYRLPCCALAEVIDRTERYHRAGRNVARVADEGEVAAKGPFRVQRLVVHFDEGLAGVERTRCIVGLVSCSRAPG